MGMFSVVEDDIKTIGVCIVYTPLDELVVSGGVM